MADNLDDTPDEADCAFIMRNIDQPEFVEAIQDVLKALLTENTSGLEIKVSMNDCEGYPVLQKIFDYMQGTIATSTGYAF